jgi:hypothetical protein
MSTRLETDRALVRTKFPRATREQWNDRLGTPVWYYRIDNELGTVFDFASFFDGALYRTALVSPAGLEEELLRRAGGHKAHMFEDGYVCLGTLVGTQTLAECWSKTGMWAYNVAAFLRTGEWMFLNR